MKFEYGGKTGKKQNNLKTHKRDALQLLIPHQNDCTIIIYIYESKYL